MQVTDFPTGGKLRLTLDYFTARIESGAVDCLDGLARELGASLSLGRPRYAYSHGVNFLFGEDKFAEAWYSPGSDALSHPVVCVPGDSAGTVERAVRKLGWKYRVSRKDAALDLYDAEYFPVLVGVLKKYAVAHGLKTSCAGDWVNPVKGRTFYVGARSSRVMFRLYEWGRCHGEDPNWVRFEVEYKPQSEAERYAAADLSAMDAFSALGYPVIGKPLGIRLEDVCVLPGGAPRIRHDVARARRALVCQYGNTVERWLKDCGGDPAQFVAEVFEAVSRERERERLSVAPAVDMPELSP